MFNQLKLLLSSNKSNKIYILFFLSILILIFEMIGIGFIPIYAVLITSPETILNKIPADLNLNFFNLLNEKNLILYGSVILFLTFVIKNIFLGILIYVEGNLMKSLRLSTSKKLFNHYMNSNYLFYVNSNPATIIRTLNHDVGLAYKYISSFLLLLREFLLVFIVLILLLSVNILVYFFSFIIFSLMTAIFYFLLKNKLVDKGKALQIEHSKNIKIIGQSFSSIKEIKISQKENFFVNLYYTSVNLIEKLYFFSYLVSKYPRLLLEILAVLMITSFAFIMFFFDAEGQLIPLLALLAAACIRFIPALNSIIGSLNSLKFYSPSFDLIYKQLKTALSAKDATNKIANNLNKDKINFDIEIALKDVSFSYPNSNKLALENVNLNIKKGEIIAIIGSSGSGKTTLINLILGFISPNKGEIKVDNKNIINNLESWQSKLGYVPQDVYLMDETLRENIAFGVLEDNVNHDLINEVVKKSRLEDFINNLPDKLESNVGNVGSKISGGQRQRIGIARSLYTEPEILILDEATNSLDIENENKIIDEIFENKSDKTIIIISHRHNNLHRFDKIYKIENGKVGLDEKT